MITSIHKRFAILFALNLLTLIILVPQVCQAGEFNRADAAQVIGKHFHLTMTDDPKTLYGLFDNVFPGGFDGANELSYSDQPITLEVATVVLIWCSGWDVVHYPADLAKKVQPFVTPEGFPYYGPDPTPRSIPFVVLALQKGLLKESELPTLRQNIGPDKLAELLTRFDQIQTQYKIETPFKIMTDEGFKDQKTFAATLDSPFQFVVVPHGLPPGELSGDLTNPVFDLRGSNPRLVQGSGLLRDGRQDYFPLGALQTTFSAALSIPNDALYHQGQALYGVVDNASPTVNAIGLWGAANSLGHAARVWGGFISSSSSRGDDKDAQIIGLEIDVVNKTLPGLSPNRSKSGLQIAGIGESEVTNAIELLGSNKALWQNGVLVENHTISKTGTAFAVGQSEPMKFGLDLAHTPFTDASIALANSSPITIQSKSGAPAAIYTDDLSDGNLVLRASRSGIRITSNSDRQNLLWIQSDGSISWQSKLFRHYVPFVIIAGLLVLGSIFLNFYLLKEMKAIKSRLPPDKTR